jgi:quercetin dioxygenase-like cupin family protein
MFYVLDGTLTLQIGGETIALVEGSFACVPTGVVHTFSNQSDGVVRFLNFNTPSGWEHYMRDLDKALSAGAATQTVIGEIASRYDFKPV